MSETKTSPDFLKSQVQIRAATEADVPFIFNSWLKSYQGSVTARSIAAPVYFDFQHKAIEALLQKCNVLVACEQADPTQLYGYLVYERIDEVPVLHYAYVKHAFRQMGILGLILAYGALSPREQAFYTHETPTCLKIIRSKSLPLVYNPYLAFGVK